MPDSQRVEIIGRNHLVNELLLDDIEVARPERDRGVDLIAYIDLDETGGGFAACPIQMKASTKKSFALVKKYEKFSRLLLVFIWGLDDPEQTEVFALTYAESHVVADQMGWLKTASWLDNGKYTNNEPGVRLRSLLEPYRMERGAWKQKIRSVASDAGSPIANLEMT